MCRRIFKEQTSENGEIPFYKIGTFGGEADAFISRELFEEYKAKYQYPKKGDILISASGSIGRTVVFTGKNEYFQDSNIVWLNHDKHLDNSFLKCFYSIVKWAGIEGSTIKRLYNDNILNTAITLPSVEEQQKIGAYFENLDNLITLHQREFAFLCKEKSKKFRYIKNAWEQRKFSDLVQIERGGSPRPIDDFITDSPDGLNWVKIGDAPAQGNYITKTAEKIKPEGLSKTREVHPGDLILSNSMSFGKPYIMGIDGCIHDGWLLIRNKGAILDAVDEGLIERDPTRKAIIKGKKPRHKKIKYLNQFELHKLLSDLNLSQEINWDWFILLVAKTGMRFSEALAITPKDFDFSKQSLSINKTWDYKGGGGFMPTKNQSSVRKIQIDWQLIIQFSTLVKDLPEDEPIFVSEKVYNSTVNDILTRHCKKADIPVISVHGLRHTHASLLLFAGVSIASVAQRLGHSSMTTTQKTYLHIIQELENKDVDLVMRSLSSLN